MKQYSESELEALYDECLDESQGMIEIGSLSYLPSYTLKAVDPVAYRCGFSDWLDSMSDQIFYHADGEYYDEPEEEESEES